MFVRACAREKEGGGISLAGLEWNSLLDQAVLELTGDPPDSASQMLGIKGMRHNSFFSPWLLKFCFIFIYVYVSESRELWRPEEASGPLKLELPAVKDHPPPPPRVLGVWSFEEF